MDPAQSYRTLAKPFRVRVAVSNLSPRRARGAISRASLERAVAPVALVELLDTGAILDAPRDECQQGDRLKLSIETEGLSPEIKLNLAATVARVTLDPQRTDADTIEARLDQFDPRVWQTLKAGIEGRQDDVERVFQALKGWK